MSSKGKGKKKKAMKGGGAKKEGRGGDGGEDSWRPEVSDGVVEVLFVEDLVRFFKLLDSANDRIPPTFLNDILFECHQKWQPHFPGLEVDHLMARAVPGIPSTGCTFRDWGGAVMVELKEERVNLGLIPQLLESKIEVLQVQANFMAISKMMDDKVEASSKRTMQTLEISNKLVRDLQKKQAMTQEDFEKKQEDFKKKQEELEKKQEELEGALDELKSQVLFTNQIKRRTVLERARVKVIQQLGKPSLLVGQKWKDYFESFDLEDWRVLFGEEEDFHKMEGVKRLLASGSLKANKRIHELELEEIYDSIFAVEVAKDQKSWIWLLAFIYSITEEEIINR